MDSNLCLLATIFSSWVFVAYSQGDGPPPSYPCIQDLLPCQPYISGPTPPLPSCCVPLKGVVKDQKDCLCALFNNQGFLQTMNITQEKALALPKACGIKVDTNICKTLVHGTAPAPTKSPVAPASPTDSSEQSTSMASKHFIGGFSIINLLLALVSVF